MQIINCIILAASKDSSKTSKISALVWNETNSKNRIDAGEVRAL